MKKRILLGGIFLLSIALTSCEPEVRFITQIDIIPTDYTMELETSSSAIQTWEAIDYGERITTNDLVDTNLVNKLPEPKSTVANIRELSHAVDYYVFYDYNTWQITLDDNYEWYDKNKNFDMEMWWLYETRELLYTWFDAEINENVITFYAWPQVNNPYKDTAGSGKILANPFYSYSSTRSEDYNDFATEDNTKPVLDVKNSDQLWYAAEHGYKINPIAGSKAEKYYNEAKRILRSICDETMDDKEKYLAIFDYILYNSNYDYAALEVTNDNMDAKTSEGTWYKYKAAYLDGFFDNGIVVCDGFSKVLTLLANMEGIPTERHQMMSIEDESGDYGSTGHAYCYTKFDGTWYLSDITWCNVTQTRNDKSVIHHKIHQFFLNGYTSEAAFTVREYFKDHTISEVENLYYFKSKIFEYEGKAYDLYIESKAEADILLGYLSTINSNEFEVDFVCKGLEIISYISNECIKYNLEFEFSFSEYASLFKCK